MATQAHSMTANAAPAPLPNKDQLQRRPGLHSLPVARDSQGRSPFLLSSHSFRAWSKSTSPKTPTNHSPTAQLLESLTPRLSRQESVSSRRESSLLLSDQAAEKTREEAVLHLETCLQVSSAPSAAQEVLRASKSRDHGSNLLAIIGCGSIVACNGSPTARAVRREFPEAIASKYSGAEAVLAAVEERKAHRALLPVESSMQGTVHRTYDLLLRYNVHIVGELVQSCCNSANNGEELESKRFWVVAREASMLPPREEEASSKTAVALVLREGLGALHKALAAFAFRDIPITKLESRPWRAEPLFCPPAQQRPADAGHRKTYFQYVVFIEFQSSTASRAAQNALTQLQQLSSFLRLLGSYPSFLTTTTTPRPHIPLPRPIAPPLLVLG